jgi:multiple sugar transport system substrate-binding protein
MNSHLTRRGILQYGAALAALGAPGLTRAQSPVRLSYWHHFASQSEQKGLRRLTEMFRAKYPTISMAIETIPNAEYLTKVTASVVANSRPDTCMIAAERFADMYAMKALLDLSPEVAKWDRKADFKPSAWKGAERDGKPFGVPAYSFVNWMYYRKDFFEEAGLSGPPDTMQEFLEVCIKITNPAKNRYGFGMRGGGGGHQYLMDLLIAYGSPIVVDGKPAIDRTKAIEAVRFFSDLYTKYKVVPPSAPNDSFRQIMEGFKTGQTAMIWHHTGSLAELTAALKPNQLGTTLRPKGPVLRAARVDNLYNGVSNDRNREAAWNWVSFWAEPDPSIALLEETGYFPASFKVAQDPRITGNPLYKPAIETLSFGQNAIDTPGVEAWGQNQMFPEFQKILVGSSTVENAVDAMMRSLDKTLS